MTVEALRLVRKRTYSHQSILEDVEYFPNCHTALVEDGKLWILNERGEKNYFRDFASIKEISLTTVQM